MPVEPGSRIGSYQIVTALGAGGMGEVYRAHDSKLRRDVAVKVLPAAMASDPDRLARLTREARLLATLNHPNIAAVYGLEDTAGSAALVMELVEGPTLADRLASADGGGLPHTAAIEIARQIAAALDAAHEKNITHRDLKPANIAFAVDGTVKVLDFGLATSRSMSALDPTGAATVTVLSQPGTIVGTAAYMSPEQARGADADKRADIWAFGCVLFEMLTGRRPFDGPTASDQIAAVLTRDPDWTALPSATPPPVRRLLERCLEKDLKRRLRDIGDVDLLLDRSDSTPTHPVGSGSMKWIAAAMAVVAAVLASMLAARQTAEPQRQTAPVRFQIPTGLNLAESQQFSLSPDGRHLVFAGAGADGTMRLWVRNLDSLEARPLVGTETDVVDLIPPMFWSPDSASIAYDNRGELKKVELSGGSPQVVCAPPGYGIGGTWNHDGVILLGNATGGLIRCAASGGAATVITKLDEARQENAHMLPEFLPDGRHFLYLGSSRDRPENSAIYVDTLDGGNARPPRQLVTATALGPARYVASSPGVPTGHLLFARGETLFAQPFDPRSLRVLDDPVAVADRVSWYRDGSNFSASANGTLVYRETSRPAVLRWFDSAGVAGPPVSDPGQFTNLALSHDGRHVAVARENMARQPDYDIWILELNGTGRRITFDAVREETPLWFPDDAQILFRRGQDLYAKRVDGLSPERVVYSSAHQKFPTDISPDGQWVLFQEQTLDPVRKTDLLIVPASGGNTATAVVAGPLEQSQGVFSPDGRAIAYVSNESGVSEVFVQPFEASAEQAAARGGRMVVSKGGGSAPHWRSGGKGLLYQAPDGLLMEADCETREAIRCSAGKQLFKIPGAQSGWGIAPDGNRFLFAVPTGNADPQPFTVVLNWPATLAAKP